MEMDEKLMDSLTKSYEAMPIALKAVHEQLEKMNGFLGPLVAKQVAEEEAAKKKDEEEKLINRAVKSLKAQGYQISKAADIPVVKAESLITGEAKKLPTPPQSQEQEPLAKAEDEESEEDKKEDEKEKLDEKKAVETPVLEKKSEILDASAIEAIIKSAIAKAVPEIVESTLKKSGFTKAGFVTKSKNFGAGELPIVKSEVPTDRKEAVKALKNLSWAELTELESQVDSGKIDFPKIV